MKPNRRNYIPRHLLGGGVDLYFRFNHERKNKREGIGYMSLYMGANLGMRSTPPPRTRGNLLCSTGSKPASANHLAGLESASSAG